MELTRYWIPRDSEITLLHKDKTKTPSKLVKDHIFDEDVCYKHSNEEWHVKVEDSSVEFMVVPTSKIFFARMTECVDNQQLGLNLGNVPNHITWSFGTSSMVVPATPTTTGGATITSTSVPGTITLNGSGLQIVGNNGVTQTIVPQTPPGNPGNKSGNFFKKLLMPKGGKP